ncbi:MAG TPA: efflux RND transporter permease subunit [Thermomicrobiales bacterium]|nr:efflux RND transporter permease subunit [Thermomicrobiales bacterium]
MMRSIVESSLKLRLLVVAIAVGVMVLGIGQMRHMPVDVLPEFIPPTVEIQTEALGLSAAEVEQMITVPLEQDLLNGVAWLDEIRSDSVPGLSRIQMIFEPGTDLMRARQVVQERLTQAHALPGVGKAPQMIEPQSSTSRIMMVRMSSTELSPIEMSVLARWNIKPRILGVSGVSNVAIFGQRERQVQVQVDPEQLRSLGVSLLDVIETTGNALWVSPLSFLEASTPGTGGFIDTPNQRLTVQHLNPIVNAEGLAQVPLEVGSRDDAAGGDQPLRLGDVAAVVEDHQPLIGDAVAPDAAYDLYFVIEKVPNANTLEVTQGVEDALAALAPGLSGIEFDSTVYRPASFIEMAMSNLTPAVLAGAVLAALALGAFFFDWRIALIGAAAIPLSVVAAAFVLYLRGTTFNAILLAGFVVALGLIIDDVVNDVDTIKRRLRENRENGNEQSTAEVILAAVQETRGPAVYGTLIVLLALVPTFLAGFAGGLPGAFFAPMAVSYSLALLTSFVVALTVTPVLALVLYAKSSPERAASPVVRGLQGVYQRVLAPMVQRPRWGYALAGALLAVGLMVVPSLGQTMLPAFQDRDLLVHWEAAPGTSLPEMNRITTLVTQELEAVPGVRNVGAHVGRAITSDQSAGVNAGELWVSLEPTANYSATVAAVRNVVDGYPGLYRDVVTYPEQRVRDVLSGQTDAVVARLYGQDYAVLGAQAEKIRERIAGIDGIVDPHVTAPTDEPTLEIEVDLAKAQAAGIKPGDVRRSAAALLSGVEVGSLFDEQKVFEVVVWGAPETRHSLTSINNLLIDTPDGGHVRLGDVAKVGLTPSPANIEHDAVSRYVDIGADVQGRDVSDVAAEIDQVLASTELPREYHAELLGGYAQQQATERQLFGFAVAALIGIFLLLQAAFNSWKLAGLAFVTLPLALTGGLVAAFANGGVISLGVLAGFLAILGVATRNGIAQIKSFQRLAQETGEPVSPALVTQSARERLAPVVATAVATGLALTPLAVIGPVAGNEILHPMSVVTLGGLVTATLVNLLVVPSLYMRFAPASQPATDGAEWVAGPAVSPVSN